ncbi:hypothetical protein BGX21_006305, partial [Mortierella sp. AD011]
MPSQLLVDTNDAGDSVVEADPRITEASNVPRFFAERSETPPSLATTTTVTSPVTSMAAVFPSLEGPPVPPNTTTATRSAQRVNAESLVLNEDAL